MHVHCFIYLKNKSFWLTFVDLNIILQLKYFIKNILIFFDMYDSI